MIKYLEMSTNQPVLQPVKVSELLGYPKSTDKQPVSERKRLEPVKVKDLLASCSKTAPSSEGRGTSRTFVIPKSGRKPVRRALYEKSSSPHQSTERCDTAGPPLERIPAKKGQTKSRKSCLPPPNSIAQRHIQKVINGNIQNSTIIKEHHESSPDEYEKTSYTSKLGLQFMQRENGDAAANQSITTPRIMITENIVIEHEEFGAPTADKENIPPLLNQTVQPSNKNKANLSENHDLHLLDLWRSLITRIEKVEHNLDEVKAQQAVQIDLLRKIYGLVINKFESPKSLVSNRHDSSPTRIQLSSRSSPNSLQTNQQNVSSDRINETQVDAIVQEHQSIIEQPVAEPSKETFNGTAALEHGHNSDNKSPLIETPKPDRRILCAKSDRPLREYLIMKASMNLLETPETHGFKRNTDFDGSGMPFDNKDLRRSISSKLFDELQDLYLDSPEPAQLYP